MSEERQRSAGAVTVRQLARETSAVIDRVREKKAPMLITRYGLPVAVIQPLDIDPWEAKVSRPQVPELEEPPIDWEALSLSEAQQRVMAGLNDRFTFEDVMRLGGSEISAVMTEVVRLEIKGLVGSTFAGYGLTHLGRRVRDALNPEKSSSQKGT